MPTEARYVMTHRQKQFINATQTRVLFGGAAGGGKSYGQLLDALRYAIIYPGSKQLILRRTFPDLDRSIIRVSLGMFPKDIYSYNASSHTGKFKNGSIIDFGYCANENDVYQYQGAEYDTIRFDELTHFTESQYIYLISRLRGANNFPKQIKASTNPGGVGHVWVKARFIDPAPPETEFIDQDGQTCIFIPSRVQDNTFLMQADPDYIKRLEALDDANKRALLYGDWDIFEGQYFAEFRREIHTCDPFTIPAEWRRYRAFDYGLDRLACMWIAVDSARNAYVYREYCESDLPISRAAKEMLDRTLPGEEIYATLAPPDMWSRTVDRGRSKAEMFDENGLSLTRSSNDREAGWLAVKELLQTDANGEPRLHIFSNCRELIKCLPLLQHDEKKPTDCATEPHEITHAPDALRYFAVYWTRPNATPEEKRVRYSAEALEDWYNADAEMRPKIEKYYGGKPIL